MTRGHVWTKFLSWPMCRKCGLLALHNERTRLAIRAKCDGDDE